MKTDNCSNNDKWQFIFDFRFFAVNVGIIYFYYNSYQKIDDEDYGGPSEILKEGLMTSFSTFLVSITCYILIIYRFF